MVVRRRRDGTLHRQTEFGLVRVKSASTCLKKLFDLRCSNNLKDNLRAVSRGLWCPSLPFRLVFGFCGN